MSYKEPNAQSAVLTRNFIDTEAGSIDFGFIEYIAKIQGSIHHVLICSKKDNAFTLDNYSQWWTSAIDMVQNWKNEDELIITQNQAFFSPYRFAIVNPRLQKAVPISLLKEPLPVENKTFFILSIDVANDLVKLSNGVEYAIYPHDHGTLRKFSENDRAMIGVNSSDKYEIDNSDFYKSYIIIDTTCNSYVRVNPVG